MEDLALDRCALADGSLDRPQPVQARGEERLDRRRNGDRLQIAGWDPVPVRALEQAVVDEHREHLLDEERVAFGCIHHSRPDLGGQLSSAQEVPDQLAGLGLAQGLQQDRGRVELATAPTRAPIEQFWPRQADEQDRCVPRPVGDVLDEVEKRRRAPLQIVEDHDERPFASLRLEQLADGPESLVGRADALDMAERRAEPLCDQLCVLVSGEARPDRRGEIVAVERPNDLAQRPEGDPLAVGETAAVDDGRALAEAVQKLCNQP